MDLPFSPAVSRSGPSLASVLTSRLSLRRENGSSTPEVPFATNRGYRGERGARIPSARATTPAMTTRQPDYIVITASNPTQAGNYEDLVNARIEAVRCRQRRARLQPMART